MTITIYHNPAFSTSHNVMVLADNDLIDAMMAYPILTIRPIVVTSLGTALCRPSETILNILPTQQRDASAKEADEKVVYETRKRVL